MKKFLTVFLVLVLTLSMSCYGAPPDESTPAVQTQAEDNAQAPADTSQGGQANADSGQSDASAASVTQEQTPDAAQSTVAAQPAPAADNGDSQADEPLTLEDKETNGERTRRNEEKQTENEEETEAESQEAASSISLTSIIVFVVLFVIIILLIVILIMVASVSKTAKKNKAELSEKIKKVMEVSTVTGSEFNDRVERLGRVLERNAKDIANLKSGILSVKNTVEAKPKHVPEKKAPEPVINTAPVIKTDQMLYNEYLEGKAPQPPEGFKIIKICTNGKHLMVTDYDDGFDFYISSDEKYIYPTKENMTDFMVSNMGNSIIEFSKSSDGVKRVNMAAFVRINGSDKIIQIFTKGKAEY